MLKESSLIFNQLNLKKIIVYNDGEILKREDYIVIEEPLEIRIVKETEDGTITKSIAVTMRTPGNDIELSVGFLFSEGIISSFEQIEKIDYFKENNVIKLKLTKGTNIDIDNLSRNILTYSSCGICGASIIDLIYKRVNRYPKGDFKVDKDIILSLPSMLKQSQAIFSKTGGIHASTLFDSKGNLIELREDVGRHNAMDKLLGRMLMDKKIPLDNTMVLFSGRSSFELVQKSILAGIPFIVSIGAPSSLAVELAEAYNVTLIGFLRENKFNVYSGIERVDLK